MERIKIEDKISSLGGMKRLDHKEALPLSRRESSELVIQLRGRLSTDYIRFSEKYGGCIFKRFIEFKTIEPLRENNSGYIEMIFGGGDGAFGIRKFIQNYRMRMPDSIIPIADAPGGDLICLGISGNEEGKVYFWDHNNECDPEDYEDEQIPDHAKFKNISLIADSFESFILGLRIDSSAG